MIQEIVDQNPRETPETMLECIREHNERGEKIWGKKLASHFKGKVAAGTINRWTKMLRGEEKIREEPVTEDGIQYKYLYVAELDKKEDVNKGHSKKRRGKRRKNNVVGFQRIENRNGSSDEFMEINIQIKISGRR